jgi:hypothetical protein
MKHILLALLLTVATSAIAFPYWITVEDTEDATVYVNINTAPNHPKTITIWLLADFKNQQDGWWSSTIQEKYNCDTAQQKTQSITVFTEHMGRGDSHLVPFPSNLKEWHSFVPGSDAERLWRAACNK